MRVKEKKKSNIFYNILIVILIGIIAVCGFKIGKIYYDYYMGTKAYEDFADKVKEPSSKYIKINWKKLEEQNSDIKAWIYSKGTPIDYPVLQTDNNKKYERHLFDGSYEYKGSIWIDYRDKKPFEQFLTVLYGHSMKDGSMFHSIKGYFKEGYYKEHPFMLILMPDNKNYRLEIVSAMTINADSSLYQFDYPSDNVALKEQYINNILDNNEIKDMKSRPKVSTDDKLVMMSTCRDSEGPVRSVVWGKLVPADKDDLKILE